MEVFSGLIILWQFRHPLPESRERTALRLMAVSFFALAAYVTFESVRALVAGHDPDTSTVGIALAAASLTIMPFLSWAQRRTGRALGSNAVVADCMLVWAVVIPAFWAVTAHNTERGPFGTRLRHSSLGRLLYDYQPVLIATTYVTVLALITHRFWDYWTTLV